MNKLKRLLIMLLVFAMLLPMAPAGMPRTEASETAAEPAPEEAAEDPATWDTTGLEDLVLPSGDLKVESAAASLKSDASLFGSQPELRDGNYVKYIDRIDLSDYPAFKEFYNWMIDEATPTGALGLGHEDGSYTHRVVTKKGTVEANSSNAQDVINNVYYGDATQNWFQKMMQYTFNVFGAVDYDHPEIFWLDGSCWVTYGMTNINWSGSDELSYTLYVDIYLQYGDWDVRSEDYPSASYIKDWIAKRDKYTNQAIAAATGTTRYQKLKQLNKWLTERNSYNSYWDLNSIYHDARECISALEGRVGYDGPVCEAYARALKVICDKIGIPCVLVTGDAGGPHMWNYVKLEDGKWYVMDVTWNDPGTLEQPISGWENENYLCVGWNAISDRTVTNDPMMNGVQFTNGPEVCQTDYDPSTFVKAQISKSPVTAKVKAGNKATFTVTASGTGLEYQWQYRTSSTGTWKNTTATGAKTATLKVSATTAKSGYQYRCRIKDSAGNTVYTNAATMYVLGIKTQPETAKVVAGATATFTVSAAGHNKTYQWQYKTSSSGTWKNCTADGNKTATVKVAATTGKSSYYYRCKIMDSAGHTVYTDTVRLYVLGVTDQPDSKTVAAGKTAQFTVKATGHNKTYQWQYRTSSTGTWKNTTATGAKTATLKVNVTAAKNGYQYRCRITDSAGNVVVSKAATLKVK